MIEGEYRYRHFKFRNLIETKIPAGFVICNGKHSRNDRNHYINKFGYLFINSNHKQGIIHPFANNYGYNIINFNDENGKFKVQVSYLVVEAFLTNPKNFPTIDHRNRIRNDDRLENLRYASYEIQNQNKNHKMKMEHMEFNLT